jgi:hypothetical protein
MARLLLSVLGMNTRQTQAEGTETRPRRSRESARRAGGSEEVLALAADYLRAVTSGARPHDESRLTELRGFPFGLP